ncbi:hypothetical protein MRX96_046889 [Rhipicephalus microplus]
MRVKKVRTHRLAGLRLRQVCPAPQVSAAVVRERLAPCAVAKLGSHAAPHTETPRGRRAFTVGGNGLSPPDGAAPRRFRSAGGDDHAAAALAPAAREHAQRWSGSTSTHVQ